MNGDLISREALKKGVERIFCIDSYHKDRIINLIESAPKVEPTFGVFREMLCSECEKNCTECKEKRPQGKCKTCRYYHPYFKQYSNEPRGDGYCVIARMTPEGMTTMNCNDEFGCSDYQEGGANNDG